MFVGRTACSVLVLFAVGGVLGQEGPLTHDFQDWLNKNDYGADDFVRSDLGNSGSYGGRSSPGQKVTKQPVIFIHGNSDTALRHLLMSGWSNSIAYFLQHGYTSSELYATTWGDGNSMNAAMRTHDCPTLTRMRRFVEAVLAYTKASAVDVVTHSMGVTIGRKILQGGKLVTPTGTCDLGSPLTGKVDTFVGLAGGNYGLCACEGADALVSPTCNKFNGFWPGDNCGMNTLDCGGVMVFPCDATIYSSFLTDLNSSPHKPGKYIFSAWSLMDDLIMFGDQVWGKPTSLIPHSTAKKVYPAYTHMQTKEDTAADQFDMVVHHTV